MLIPCNERRISGRTCVCVNIGFRTLQLWSSASSANGDTTLSVHLRIVLSVPGSSLLTHLEAGLHDDEGFRDWTTLRKAVRLWSESWVICAAWAWSSPLRASARRSARSGKLRRTARLRIRLRLMLRLRLRMLYCNRATTISLYVRY